MRRQDSSWLAKGKASSTQPLVVLLHYSAGSSWANPCQIAQELFLFACVFLRGWFVLQSHLLCSCICSLGRIFLHDPLLVKKPQTMRGFSTKIKDPVIAIAGSQGSFTWIFTIDITQFSQVNSPRFSQVIAIRDLLVYHHPVGQHLSGWSLALQLLTQMCQQRLAHATSEVQLG